MRCRLGVCLILLSCLGGNCIGVAAEIPSSAEDTLTALVARVLPGREQDFVFETIPAADGKDVFELESRDGKVVVRGNSPVSMAFGLNWYLKYYGRCQVSINGRQVNLASPPPVVEAKVRRIGWAPSRYLLNYVTFAYSACWWDWDQWERCIDWMALNGVTMPLAITGQEAVWQAVCRRFGMTEAEIEAFLAGPPYLPFSWMGCLDGHGGPLPKNWISARVDLQRKILARQRELGMTPVLQGFTGHIPAALLAKHPTMKVQQINWLEFKTTMLDPQDPLFSKIAAAFLEEQTRLFGTDHLYAADPFIEMTPPSGELPYLAGIGRAIYEGMAKVDPEAVWLLQSWAFWCQNEFWRPDRVQAFLDAVPNDRMLVLDLYCDHRPVWSETNGFYGKPWLWCFVYNFGDTVRLASPLGRFSDLGSARTSPLGKNLRGVGLMMEGFGHNPVIFELMSEAAWRDDVYAECIAPGSTWTRHYALSRYGSENQDACAALEKLHNDLYLKGIGGGSVVTCFPGCMRIDRRSCSSRLSETWRLLLRAAPELHGCETYRHDLVNIARQTISNHANECYDAMLEAKLAGDAAAFRKASSQFLDVLRDLDELLATHEAFLLGPWLEDAKRWGATDAERARLEWNARRLLTLWGNGTTLRDYACKEWSGMVGGFYAKRWGLFCQRQQEALDAGKPLDEKACNAELFRFEDEWASSRDLYPTKPRGDSVQVARRLFEKYGAAKIGAGSAEPSPSIKSAPAAGESHDVIVNARVRRDVNGEIINAHDGCLEQFGDRFYLYGTAYGAEPSKRAGLPPAERFVCYSSTNLVDWVPHGPILRQQPKGYGVRPYVKYNAATRKYVLWFSWFVERQGVDGKYAVAVADAPEGPFEVKSENVRVARSPLICGDLGLFVDDDGTGYVIYTAVDPRGRPRHHISIDRLEPDYLSSTLTTSGPLQDGGGCEAPAMFKRGKLYYALFDRTCSYCPQGSGARVLTATSPLGPYTYRNNINRGADGSPVVAAQQTHVAKIDLGHGAKYLWMGDRWYSDPYFGHSLQYWSSPLSFDDEGAIGPLRLEDHWSLDRLREQN